MSAAAKFGARLQSTPFMAGYCIATRNELLSRARESKRRGYAQAVRTLVTAARQVNRELVGYLQAASARVPFADYDRERRISATGAFGRVPYNPPAGTLDP